MAEEVGQLTDNSAISLVDANQAASDVFHEGINQRMAR
jgi:hypothetical protein